MSGHNPTTNEVADELPNVARSHENPVTADTTRQEMPWWKRPAPWWLMILGPVSTITLTATAAPQIELYTTLACRVHHKPGFESEALTNIDTSLLPRGLPSFPSSFSVVVDNVVQSTFFKRLPVEVLDSNPCASEPAVQATVATLTTVIKTVTGILTLATVGWWGSFSDRHGRKRMMGISAVGQVISSLNILLVAKFIERIPGGYWLLVVDAAIVGGLGGHSSAATAIHAYIADVSTPDKRSRIFSIVIGSTLIGVGIGPVLGSIIIRSTHNLLTVFYLAAAFRILHACFVWLVLPESLTAAQMHRASIRYQEHSIAVSEPTPLLWFKRFFFFLLPLSVLWPEKISHENASKGAKRDWNLPILVLADGLMTLAASSIAVQLLYALYTFGWDAEYLGYCISSFGVTRAIYLMLVLPFAVKFLKNRKGDAGPRSPESEPLLSDQDSDSASRLAPSNTHASAFDLGLARFSMLVDISIFAALPFAPTGIVFIFFTMVGALGAGLNPAFHSVALEIYSRKFRKNESVESGKLFGALSVVSSISAQVVGPPMYGFIYAATVATFPQTIFFVAVGNSAVAFALLACVRLRPGVRNSEDVEDLSVLRDQSGNPSGS
ncbi:major facilitator superfamily domain-containing protein [Mycena latifolia]|nr:major facilitator superfamily domain-containing protein [Mycena latifolia]